MIATGDVSCGEDTGQHGVILVVVSMLAVAADELQVRKVGKIRADPLQRTSILVVVHRIGLGRTDHGVIDDLVTVDQPQGLEFSNPEVAQLLIGEGPEIVPLLHEVLEPE